MFKITWNSITWYQSAIRFADGIWLDVRRQGDYRPVPLFYDDTQLTLGMDGIQ